MRVLWWMCILCDWSSAGFLPQDAENKAMLICYLECSSFSERKKRPFRGSSFSPSLSLSLSLSLRSRRQSLCCGFTAAKFKWWTVKSGTEDTIAKSHFFGTGSRPSCMFLTLLLLFINTPLHIHAHLKKKKTRTCGHLTCRGTLQRARISQREKWRNQAERILGLVCLHITAIFTSAQSFLFLPCMQSCSCVCV